ncbi:hypothetical protein DdX_13758 [Ditylenchus destructor]|uniref:Uncharacterized protein n=1 Tax=Ditylenchus destructor TaxID=166010 RepID=A0AAD4MTI7_9BILA|nr:hypothetical protein DdX_13758 [Ditylenchus destructor]
MLIWSLTSTLLYEHVEENAKCIYNTTNCVYELDVADCCSKLHGTMVCRFEYIKKILCNDLNRAREYLKDNFSPWIPDKSDCGCCNEAATFLHWSNLRLHYSQQNVPDENFTLTNYCDADQVLMPCNATIHKQMDRTTENPINLANIAYATFIYVSFVIVLIL